MGLLQEWREYAYGVELNSKEGKAIWDKYFEQEKAIYQQLLAAPEEVASGTVQELAELKKPMVQTDNSQSHWFSLSKYVLWFFYNFYFTFSNLLFASKQTLSPSLMLHS